MADYFGTMAKSASDSKVGKALSGIAKSYAKLAKAYGKLLIDEDLSAAADAMRAMSTLQESLESFQKLCGA